MKPVLSIGSLLILAMSTGHADTIFSWETGLEGWFSSNPVNAPVATSTTSPTDGTQSLSVTLPMSSMWYNDSTRVSLDETQRQAIFDGAETLTLDVTYPNPGYNSWFVAPTVEMVVQDQGFQWISLGNRPLVVDGTATCSWTLTPSQATAFATGTSATIILRFVYGNGGATGTHAVFYLDKLTSNDPPPPPPFTSNYYWKGNLSASWVDNNWTTAEDGLVPTPQLLPADGTEAVAFSADGAANLATVLGSDQAVTSVNFTGGSGVVSIGGTHNLILGADGITANEGSGSVNINTTGMVILNDNQVWRNNSTNPLTVSSEVTGFGKLSIGGTGTIVLTGANTHTGGTAMQSGRLEMGNLLALGPVDTIFTADGGTLDLKGFSPTLGGISGGGIITNTVAGTSTLTIDGFVDGTYIGKLNDGGEGQVVALVKAGSSNLTLGGLSSFTGNVMVNSGILTATTPLFGAPNTSNLGNSQTAGRTITVASGATLRLSGNNIFGNQFANFALLPAVFVNQGILEAARYNTIGTVTLDGGTLAQSSPDTGIYQGYQFKGDIVVTGTTPSAITTSTGKANHLAMDTVFDVADVTESPDTDLDVLAPLWDQSGDFANAAGSLIKRGVGTMALGGGNSYTGATLVEAGTLALSGSSALSDTAPLNILDGAQVRIDSESEVVGELQLNGSSVGLGVFGASDNLDVPLENRLAAITGAGVIIVSSDPFPAWILGYPGLNVTTRAKDADPDQDGVNNLTEFGLNGNPVDAKPSGKLRSAVEPVETEQALVLTLPVRNDADFIGTSPAVATLEVDQIIYRIEGSNELENFNQSVSEIPVDEPESLPGLDPGWTYRSFRLNGAIDSRGPAGFIRAGVFATP